jgi:hypothetical protein
MQYFFADAADALLNAAAINGPQLEHQRHRRKMVCGCCASWLSDCLG